MPTRKKARSKSCRRKRSRRKTCKGGGPGNSIKNQGRRRAITPLNRVAYPVITRRGVKGMSDNFRIQPVTSMNTINNKNPIKNDEPPSDPDNFQKWMMSH
jgi:hypothetical protein